MSDMGSAILKEFAKAGLVMAGIAGVLTVGGIKGYQYWQESRDPLVKNGATEVRINSGRVFTRLTPQFGRAVDFNRQEIADVFIVKNDTAHVNTRRFENVTDSAALRAIDESRAALRTAQAKR